MRMATPEEWNKYWTLRLGETERRARKEIREMEKQLKRYRKTLYHPNLDFFDEMRRDFEWYEDELDSCHFELTQNEMILKGDD